MNQPIDPISVRQARQGKPVLVILTISMVLAIIAGWVLWGAIAEDTGSGLAEAASVALPQTMTDAFQTA
ncbi:hypothetical protein [Hoeflea sp.]|uniref:hypothetical protein n=1 Tax=Hoeflea sp. TaxID=1940281 RepID=UPI003A8F63CD